jgi:hypothetical protein
LGRSEGEIVAVLMTQLLPANGGDLLNRFRFGVSGGRRPPEPQAVR